MSIEGRGFESRSQQQSALWAKVEFRFRAVPYTHGKHFESKDFLYESALTLNGSNGLTE